jgi:hypothetical protein
MSDETVGTEPQLYVVYLGGDPSPGRLSEDHEVVTVVAANLKEARRAARAKWGGESRAHVDAVQILNVVDGFAIRLEPTNEPEDNTIDATYVPADDAQED